MEIMTRGGCGRAWAQSRPVTREAEGIICSLCGLGVNRIVRAVIIILDMPLHREDKARHGSAAVGRIKRRRAHACK